jgi:hypothetical protein
MKQYVSNKLKKSFKTLYDKYNAEQHTQYNHL